MRVDFRDRFVYLLVLILFAISVIPLNSQIVLRDKHHGTFRRGIAAADQRDFSRAIELFSEILAESPNHVDALTQLGVTFIDSNQKLDSAILVFRKVLSIIPEQDLFDPFGIYVQQMMARAYSLRHEPDKALEILSHLKDSTRFDDLLIELTHDINQATNAKILLNNPIALKISNPGANINSFYDDHSPLVCITGKRMFFTSRRPVGKDRLLPDGQYPENIFMSEFDGENWQTPTPVPELIKRNEHASILSLSPDGEQLFLYKTEGGLTKNIYVSHLIDNKWQEPVKLPAPINSAWDETHASLSPDRNTLYFTSNRPGGFGGLDIYSVRKDAYGSWEEPVNLGPSINSPHDEESPMMHPDGQTLYFISDGHASMGGFDVFYSHKLHNGQWAQAVNLGYPINSADDDLFFLPTLDKSQAYMSSYRFSEGHGQPNIYQVSFSNEESGSLAVIEGTVKNQGNLPLSQLRILVWRESDNAQVGDYRPNPVSGKYLLILNTDERYRIQEATPETVQDLETIYLSPELAFNRTNRIILSEDIKMLSPLIPQRSLAVVDTPTTDGRETVEKADQADEAPTFTIQILALQKQKRAHATYLRGLEAELIKTFRGDDGYLRYVYGQFKSETEARNHLVRMQRNGRFQDAWIRELSVLEDLSSKQDVALVK